MFNIIPLPYKIAAIAFILIGAYISGYVKGNAKAEAEIAKYAAKAAALANQVKDKEIQIKEVIVTEYVDKIQKVKEKEYVYIKQAETVVPSQYILSNGWVYLHDTSAQGGIADSTRAADASPSDIKDNQALGTIVENYGICQQNAQQLASLQEYISKVKEAVEKSNKNPIRK